MKRLWIIVLVVALAAIGGGYFLWQSRTTPLDPPAAPATAQAPSGETPRSPAAAPTPAAQPDQGAVTQTPATTATPPAPRPVPFEFRRVTVDTSSTLSEACLSFSKPLDSSGNVKYEDYLRISPVTKVAVRVVDDRLCLGGLSFGRDYEVQILAGLPSAQEDKLAGNEVATVALGARPPLVAFLGNGLILPREPGAGVPLTTVNVDTVRLKVFRVSDRIIARLSRDEFDEKKISPWRVQDVANDSGALLWEGTMPVKSGPNETVSTSFPIRETIKPWKPGMYLVVAWNDADGRLDSSEEENFYGYSMAAQWVVDSDIGLTTLQGTDGLHVYARSLNSAQPLSGIQLTLVARNNEELGRATTDGSGHAVFAPGLSRGTGGMQAVAVMAYGAEREDFNYIDITRAGFDLSDRGVEGRAAPGPIDAYLYLDRGIYRPGETVHIMTLLRDRTANAVADLPLTVIVRRPDGVEYRRATLQPQNAGGAYYALDLGPSARRGVWQALAYLDPNGSPVGNVEFSVEDFVPQRLKLALSAATRILKPGEEVQVNVEGRFLYGAPAAELDGEAEVSVAPDPKPFPNFANFRFGLVQEKFKDAIVSLDLPRTDSAGRTLASGPLNDLAPTTLPLKATVSVALHEPGGRATRDEIVLPVRSGDLYVGIRPRFEDYAQESAPAEFEVIAVDAEGRRVAREGLTYELVREQRRYQWYRTNNTWRYEVYTRDIPVTSGSLSVGTERPEVLSQTLSWGYYRLTVADRATGAATSVQFWSGWGSSPSAETPDTVTVTSDKQNYASGETARVRIEAPFAGEALVVIANDRVFEHRLIKVAAEGTTVEIPVSAEWGSGAYALVSAFRPLSARQDRGPVRAIGVVWLGVDMSSRTLAVELGTPERIVPRQTVGVPVRVPAATGGEVFVTLAAVDEGILQLTKFPSPSPEKYYFGKRRLTVGIRDDYGRLLDPTADVVGQIRQGGDAAGGKGLEVVPTRTVALFSGPVKLDADGAATIPLEVPDFVGELRLMAVAYDKTRVGSGSKPLTVRDAVVSDVTLPRFLAPGDQGRLSLLLHNVEGAPGAYRLSITGEGAVALPTPVQQTVDLPAGKRQLLGWPVRGREIGIGKLTLRLEGPNGFAVTRDWQIEVRPAQAPQTIELVSQLKPEGELQVDPTVLDTFVPGSTTVGVSVASVRGIDVAALLRALDRYPFGCLEQTTSRAMPLLYFNDLALLGGVKDDKGLEGRVQEAIYHILDMQRSDGGFGMWYAGSTGADPWLQTYAIDFLAQARTRNYTVPEAALRRGLNWLRGTLTEFSPEAKAYAWYVLARAGMADVGQLRYFQDAQGGQIRTSMGYAQLAGALAMVGEKVRAEAAFAQARRTIGVTLKGDYYGSPLRDLAGLTAIAAGAGQTTMLPDLTSRLQRSDRLTADYTTTQEKSWLLLAAHAMTQSGSPLTLAVNGQERTVTKEPAVFNPDPAALRDGFVVRNRTDREVWGTVSVRGVPKAPQPAVARGLRIERSFLKLDGTLADLTQVRQNDRLMVILTGRALDREYHETALLDLLPAGWEIEAVIPQTTEDQGSPYSWLPKISYTRNREARDDRFFASFALGRPTYFGSYRGHAYYDESPSQDFTLAYIVRAVTPGTYTLPAAQIEDMYRPGVIGRTEAGMVTVLPRE